MNLNDNNDIESPTIRIMMWCILTGGLRSTPNMLLQPLENAWLSQMRWQMRRRSHLVTYTWNERLFSSSPCIQEPLWTKSVFCLAVSQTFLHIKTKQLPLLHLGHFCVSFRFFNYFVDVLVISKRVAFRLEDLTPDEVADLFQLVQVVEQLMEKVHHSQSSTVTAQDGEDAGQTVRVGRSNKESSNYPPCN